MPDLSLLLVLVIALAAGLVASMTVANYMQSAGGDFYRSYLTSILLFNLLILFGMVYAVLGQSASSLVLPVFLVIMAALKLAWLASFAVTMQRLQGAGSPISRQSPGRVLVAAFILYSALMMIGWMNNVNSLSQVVNISMELLVIGGALFFSALGVNQARRDSMGALRAAKLQFTLFHAVLMILILLYQVYSWFPNNSKSSWMFLVNGSLLLLFNLFPIGWIRQYRPAPDANLVERLKRYGISERERQIIELIRLGKTNQDIADKLFISLATVKDHNNRIFKKCGVRNRVELASLFSDS